MGSRVGRGGEHSVRRPYRNKIINQKHSNNAYPQLTLAISVHFLFHFPLVRLVFCTPRGLLLCRPEEYPENIVITLICIFDMIIQPCQVD